MFKNVDMEMLVEGGGLLRASCPPPLRGQPSALQNRSRRFCRTGISFSVVLIHLQSTPTI
jgi:hypothetical protein